jgi:nucleoside-diphosphate-sugar epimerase
VNTKKILILGGKGLIGGQLANELAKDYQVIVVDKKVNNDL